MADNTTLNAGSGGDTIAADEISSVKYQRGKLIFGADGTNAGDVSTTNGFPIQLADSPALDSFGRLRVSNPTTLFSSTFQYDLNRVFWEEVTAGSGSVTHLPNESSARLGVTASASDSAILQSREYLRYQPGKSQELFMTFNMSTAAQGSTHRVGLFDDDDGVFLERTGSGATTSFVVRTSTSGSSSDSNSTAQALWSVDVFDGTGASGITLDLTKNQILWIDLEWLGMGRVRFGFVVNGIKYVAHENLSANNDILPYMKTASLPARYELSTDGSAIAAMDCTCTSISSEGGLSLDTAHSFSASNGTTAISVNTTLLPLISIRPKSTFNSIVNRGLIIPRAVSAVSATKPIHWQLVYGTTLTGASYSSANADSIVEFDVSASALSGGIVVEDGYSADDITASADILSRFPIALDKAGSHPTSPYADCFTVAASSLTAGATDVNAAIRWAEVR